MRFVPSSRRMFLVGAGTSLALPLLPSLLPRGARAQIGTTPVRYLQVFNPYGPVPEMFYGNPGTDQQPEPGVGTRALADIGGDISPIFSAAFDPFRSRMSLLRGLDVLIENPNHNYLFPSCASGYASGVDNDEAPPLSGQDSVDSIIAANIYGDDTPEVRRVVYMNPVDTDDYSGNRSFSWRGGGSDMVRPAKQTQGILDPFAAGFAMGGGEEIDPRDHDLVEAVYSDYKRVRDGTRISAADKQRLDAYMNLVHEIIDGDITAICEDPGQADESSIDAVIDNQFRIIAAAMACGLTRVASIVLGMSQGYGTRHEEHHALYQLDGSGLENDFKAIGGRVAGLLGILDGIAEDDGSMLDNSIVYWSMQYGCMTPSDQHSRTSMPVMVAGGAGGRLALGHYIDYRGGGSDRGILLNNLLVTFMNCMGLSSSVYETGGGAGYGYYNGDFDGRPNADFWRSDEGRRSPLPVIYQGPSLG